MKDLHPYSLILGVGIGVATMFALRFIPLAFFTGLIATVLIDYGLKAVMKSGDDRDDD